MLPPPPNLRAQAVQFRIQGLAVQDSRPRVQGLGCRVWASGFLGLQRLWSQQRLSSPILSPNLRALWPKSVEVFFLISQDKDLGSRI